MNNKGLARAADYILLLGFTIAILAGCAQKPATEAAAGGADTAIVDAGGNLRVPADYRATYQTLGTWAIAADTGKGSKEMHIVYASPGAAAAYQKSRHFPDGTVLVKEVY